MAGINGGTPINRFRIVPAAPEPIPASALPAKNQNNIIAELRAIEAEAEAKIRDRRGIAYQADPFKTHLEYLAKEDQDYFRYKYLKALGGEDVLAAGLGPQMALDYVREGKIQRAPWGRLVFSPSAIAQDIRAAFFSQTTLGFRHGLGATVTDQYQLPLAMPRVENVMQDMQTLSNFIEGHGKTLIFDVEAPSLDPEQGLWMISAKYRGGEAPKTWYFDNPYMKQAIVAGKDGLPQRLDEHLLPKKAKIDEKANFLDFFRYSEEAQIMAGHNVPFDYSMVSTAVRKSEAYKNDTEFRAVADSFLAKFTNPVIRRVVDTSVLARMILPDIGMHPRIAEGPMPTTHSIQNILLRTDILPNLAQQGVDVDAMLGIGTHKADIDVELTDYILDALRKHYLFQQNLPGGRQIQLGNELLPSNQLEAIAKSAAIGPHILLVDPDLFLPGMYEKTGGKVTPFEQMVLASRDLTLEAKTPLTHTQEDIIKQINTQDRTFGRRAFGRKFQNLITESGLLNTAVEVPNIAEWNDIKQELADKGVPIPGLSLFERHITSVMSSISGPGMGSQEAQLRDVAGADMLGLGRFVESQELKVLPKSRIVVAPLRYLREWEEQEKILRDVPSTDFSDEGLQFLGFSPFQWRPAKEKPPIKEVGLNLRLEEDQQQRLLRFLSEHPDISGNEELINQLREALNTNSGLYGLQIGTLGGVGPSNESVNKFYDVLTSYTRGKADVSDQTPMFYSMYAGSREGAHYTAGIVMRPELLSDEERRVLQAQKTSMAANYHNIINAKRSTMDMSNLLTARKSLANQDQMTKWFTRQQRIFKSAPYAIAGLALTGLGYYYEKKHHRSELVNETFAAQPTEASNWYSNNKSQTVPYSPYRRPHNQLATANVVSNLDDNKINHTNMSQSQKYKYLFQTQMTGGGYNSSWPF